ncbi:kinetochore Sim4 complex subunit FTA2-domain-containing protein [Chaetomium fimeti]|uniref:Kinetochore Sim4 complex subunit FTA2-domain-containing protein n=1 Tax=Chaetomium fimeti TaxID=1854472 RepID=A0AAE0LUL2_9PEZI|nr:kinetochore Sim4 complex subunit FTA2-domain-containing protein [Chaetomium fimeti]
MASSVFRFAPLPSPPVPLPGVPGPKLAPFTPNARADIEFIEFLGEENNVDSQVWKVKINGAGQPGLFALKMFYFRHSNFLRRDPGGDLTTSLANSQLYADYFDPFNCECRAYGRLKEENREDLAAKAYGYLLLTPEQEAGLARDVTGEPSPPPDAEEDEPLDGQGFWRRWEQHRGLPLRAIVKELVPRGGLNPNLAQGMWADLKSLHSLGIFVGDTHGGNFMGGKLVDFSRSWTMYHPAMVQIRDKTLQDMMLVELQDLLDYCYFLKSSLRAIAIPDDLEAFCSGHLAEYKGFPWAYNWLKWEKNADAAQAFVEEELFEREAH